MIYPVPYRFHLIPLPDEIIYDSNSPLRAFRSPLPCSSIIIEIIDNNACHPPINAAASFSTATATSSEAGYGW